LQEDDSLWLFENSVEVARTIGVAGCPRATLQRKRQEKIANMKQAKMIDKHVRARRADNRDAEVGRRVRSRRLECRLSQTELADRIGVTFQQVQKYEKGVNRIGAGRLQRISEALEVPISFFFDGKSGTAGSPKLETGSGAESIFGFMQTSGSVRIVKAFHKIKSRKARQLLVEMAEELADTAAA
jgi:transcriptional regulator with XRE-family HTH domain